MATSFEPLRNALHGPVILPHDADYERARRVWNGMIDRRPSAIARCLHTADVVACVNFARREGLLVAVRGGGHSVAGNGVCDDGLVIDLSQMRNVEVDATQRRARAQGGATWGDFDQATQAVGLAATGGEVSTTGIGGLTLGGGLGWLMGKHGLACDNLVRAEVVCADGTVLVANERDHTDLLWALRGGGGNFGVVTRFDYRLHPLRQILAGLVVYPMHRAPEVLRCYRECTAECPDELTAMALLLTTADGEPAVGAIVCHCGDSDQAEKAVQPLRSLGGVLADTIGPMPYVGLQKMLDETTPAGRCNYWKACFVPALEDELIETLAAHSAAIPSPYSSILIEHLHGAVCRVGATETAFGVRQPQYSIGIFSVWTQELAAPHRDWTERAHAAVRPYSGDRAYVNYLGEAAAPQLRRSYGDNYDRLVAVKTTFDPTNFFRVNLNIPPKEA